MKRQVYIQPITSRKSGKIIAYALRYVERRKGSKYNAGHFERIDRLHAWLATQPNLELINLSDT